MENYLSYDMPARISSGMEYQQTMNKTRILCVDDDALVLELMGCIFNDFGFEVKTAKNAIEAIRILEQYPMDLMVTDFNMPIINGISLASKTKKRWKGLPIILISGNSSAGLMHLDDFENIDVFLNKPFKIDEVLTAIRQVEEGYAISLVR
jgi:two-component system response regulator YesN